MTISADDLCSSPAFGGVGVGATAGDARPLAVQWMGGLRILNIAHKYAAARCRHQYRSTGLLATVLSTLVATGLFTNASKAASPWVALATGIVSVLAAVVSASHSFLRYAERSEQHRDASAGYGDLRRELEMGVACSVDDRELRKIMEAVRTRWVKLDRSALPIPTKVHRNAVLGKELST
jgi:cobalamin biosynthesis protein CobD/CbiB